MARFLLATVLGFVLAGCSFPRYTMVPSGETSEFGVVRLGGNLSYIIDPRTETCVLVNAGPDTAWAVPVSCAKLKANVPGAAPFITWDPAATAPTR